MQNLCTVSQTPGSEFKMLVNEKILSNENIITKTKELIYNLM